MEVDAADVTDRKKLAHMAEMKDYLNQHSENFNEIIHSSVSEILGRVCQVIIASRSTIDVTFDVNHVIETVLDRTHHNFGQKQNFTDFDGIDFGHVTIWNMPNIIIKSDSQSHQVVKILFLETLESGHEIENILKILIQTNPV